MKNINKLKMPYRSCVTGAALLATSFSPAFANTAEAEASAEDVDEDVIIVQARKRDETLQDSPVVISALSEKALEDFSIESVEDISDFTPGLVADAQGNPAGGVLFLRGVGSGSGSPSIDQAVSLVVDDMQVGSLAIQNTAMVDMQSVQVYKGPQALFFGKNSPGGVVSIRTADPTDEFEGELRAGYTFETEEKFVQGVLSGPLSDNAGARLVLRYSDSDGFFDVNSGVFEDVWGGNVAGNESFLARGTLLLTPSDDWTIRAKLSYTDVSGDVDGTSQIQRIFCPNAGVPQGSPAFNCVRDNEVQIVPIPDAAVAAFAAIGVDNAPSGIYENEQLLGSLSISYDAGDDFSVTSVTGYYEVSSVQSAPTSFALLPPIAVSTQIFDFKQFTQELRFASDFEGPLNFVSGLFYEYKQHVSSNPLVVSAALFGGDPAVYLPAGVTAYEQETKAMSGFVDFTFDITDNLELAAGARYSYEQKEFVPNNGVFGALNPSGYVGDAKADWQDVSPQVTLSYDAGDWLFFASYREGFKSGGFDGAFQFVQVAPVQFEPETVDGFEVGAKGTLFDNSLQLNLAAFTYTYDELQLSLFDSEAITLKTINASSADVKGIELDFLWNTPAEGLQFRGAFAYLDAKFGDFAGPCYTGQSVVAGCNGTLVGAAFTTQDLSGASLNLASDVVASLGFSYEQDLGGLILGLSGDGVYNSGYEAATDRTPGTDQDSFTKFDASISLSDADENWTLSLIGRNLTDEYTITNGGNVPFQGSGTGTAAAIPGDSIAYVRPGRTISLEAKFNF